jgi:hypothetical protein
MSYPKKAEGWRCITVESQRFRWRFVAGDKASNLILQGSVSSSQQVIVTLTDWRDPWLFVGQTAVPENEPKVVTARFASQAISFALAQGWKPEETGPPMRVDYRDRSFNLSSE